MSASDFHRHVREVYGTEAMSDSKVRKWVKKFQDGLGGKRFSDTEEVKAVVNSWLPDQAAELFEESFQNLVLSRRVVVSLEGIGPTQFLRITRSSRRLHSFSPSRSGQHVKSLSSRFFAKHSALVSIRSRSLILDIRSPISPKNSPFKLQGRVQYTSLVTTH
ncbi:hypothetical protein TNCV_12941 [Trichonephila clavipes]|nr:hypothetical protein TNCV_12941 [Trichonephila clavipes]